MKPKWLMPAAVVVLAGAAAWLAWRAAQQSARVTALMDENRALAARAGQSAPPAGILTPPPAAPLGEPRRQPAPLPGRTPEPAPPAEDQRALETVRARLTAATQSLDELKNRLAETESSVARLTEENLRVRENEQELREKLNSAERILDAVRAELKSKSDRIFSMEISARTILEENRKVEDRLSTVSKTSQELQDLQRRRDVYLTSILRRYRELTDLYRGLAVRLERGSDSATLAAGDLSRIQQAINMTDEDLRQLNTLNAQAQQLLARMKADRP